MQTLIKNNKFGFYELQQELVKNKIVFKSKVAMKNGKHNETPVLKTDELLSIIHQELPEYYQGIERRYVQSPTKIPKTYEYHPFVMPYHDS